MAPQVPAGYTTLTPHLAVRSAAAAVDFYERAFGAGVLERLEGPDGSLLHATLEVGGSRFKVSEEFPGVNRAPPSLGGTSVMLHLYVADADAAFARAVAAGATAQFPPTDVFWGDRFAKVADPFGHEWTIATRIGEPSADDVRAALAQMLSGG